MKNRDLKRSNITLFAILSICLSVHFPWSSGFAQPIQVLYFVGLEILPPSEGDASRLEGLGMAVTVTTDPGALDESNMSDFDVVVLWQVPSGIIGAQRAALEAYVRSGKGLFVHAPGGEGPLDYLPVGYEVTVLSQEICNPSSSLDTEMCVVLPSHPLVSGYDGFDLSYAALQIGDIGSMYTILAQNCLCGDPSLAVATLGGGRIVLDTGFFATTTLFPGDDGYVAGLIEYLSGGGSVPVLPGSWSLVKSSFN